MRHPPSSPPPSHFTEVGGHWATTILIGTHHKTGTVLLAHVFRMAAKFMGVPRIKNNRTIPGVVCNGLLALGSPGVCIIEHITLRDILQHHVMSRAHVGERLAVHNDDIRAGSRNDHGADRRNSLPAPHPHPTPLVHAVRDPLEMCVSAYQYHTLGAEAWLRQPMRDLNGSTMQQLYTEHLSPTEGVVFECKRMILELVETALVYNATRDLPNTLTVRLEDFTLRFDDTTRRLFTFLDSGQYTDTLVEAATKFDLARTPVGNFTDAKHVSAASTKQPLRDALMQDSQMGRLLFCLRWLLGYRDQRHHRPPPPGLGAYRLAVSQRGRNMCPTAQHLLHNPRWLFPMVQLWPSRARPDPIIIQLRGPTAI